MAKTIVAYFQDLFKSANPINLESTTQFIYPIISDEMNTSLEADFEALGASILTYETSAFDCPLKLVKSVPYPSATPWLPSSTEDLLKELVSLPCKSDSLSLDRIKEKAGIAFTANLSSF